MVMRLWTCDLQRGARLDSWPQPRADLVYGRMKKMIKLIRNDDVVFLQDDPGNFFHDRMPLIEAYEYASTRVGEDA